MKKLTISSAIALCLSITTNAGTPSKYCDLVVYRQFLKNFVAEMHVDGKIKTSQTLIRDADGNKVKFACEADALNYMAQQGWELVSSYNRNHNETHFIISRKSIP
jgi:hypothetical protein